MHKFGISSLKKKKKYVGCTLPTPLTDPAEGVGYLFSTVSSFCQIYLVQMYLVCHHRHYTLVYININSIKSMMSGKKIMSKGKNKNELLYYQ